MEAVCERVNLTWKKLFDRASHDILKEKIPVKTGGEQVCKLIRRHLEGGGWPYPGRLSVVGAALCAAGPV